MLEIQYKNPDTLVIKNADKKEVSFYPNDARVELEDFVIQNPGEYEKSGNLLEVQEFQDILFYKFLIDGKHVVIVTSDDFDLKEDVLGFFGDVDVLIIVGSKAAVKIFENIEAKMVIPYGEGKEVFLNTLSQHPEPTTKQKVGSDLDGERTEYVNLES